MTKDATGDPIRVLVADDQDLIRGGIRMILEAHRDITVVAEAADGGEAVALAEDHQPDVVLMDIHMPGTDGLEATRLIGAVAPKVHVLILTTFDNDDYVYRALRDGAAGFLLKTAPPSRLVDAVRTVASGEALLAPTITRRLIEQHLNRPTPNADSTARLGSLTGREREVLTHIARGLSNQEIATELFLSEPTVKSHINRILQKASLRDRAQAVVLAYETGLVQPGG
jgi:DNA-binding NarL/FixJ family response regulator